METLIISKNLTVQINEEEELLTKSIFINGINLGEYGTDQIAQLAVAILNQLKQELTDEDAVGTMINKIYQSNATMQDKVYTCITFAANLADNASFLKKLTLGMTHGLNYFKNATEALKHMINVNPIKPEDPELNFLYAITEIVGFLSIKDWLNNMHDE